jgi:hypothetical protein
VTIKSTDDFDSVVDYIKSLGFTISEPENKDGETSVYASKNKMNIVISKDEDLVGIFVDIADNNSTLYKLWDYYGKRADKARQRKSTPLWKYTTMRQVGGDDGYQWTIMDKKTGEVIINGMTRTEAMYERPRVEKRLKQRYEQ